MKITTEMQRNAKLLHLSNKKVICLTLTDKKNTISRQNWTWALACTFTDSAETFLFQNEHFSLNLDFQDYENEIPNKRVKKITEEELEKSIEAPFFSRFTRHMTRAPD